MSHQFDSLSDLLDTHNLWAVTPGPRGDKWSTFLETGIASTGHDLLKGQEPDRETIIQTIGQRVEDEYKGQYQAYLFQERVNLGDILVAKRGARDQPILVYGIGRVADPYDPSKPRKLRKMDEYEPTASDHYKHQIRVDWIPFSHEGIELHPQIVQFPGQTFSRLAKDELFSLLHYFTDNISNLDKGMSVDELIEVLNNQPEYYE